MKKLLLVALFATGIVLSAQECGFEDYQVKLVDNYVKDSGLIQIILGGKQIFHQRSFIYFSYLDEDKVTRAREIPSLEYQFKDNVFTTARKAAGKDGKELAKIDRTINFEPQAINVELMVKASVDFNLQKPWHGYSELLHMPVSELAGATLEATRGNGTKVTAMIPREYSKENWSFRPQGDKNIKLILEHYIINISCSENAVIILNHYGGKSIEINLKPEFKNYETEVKAGSEKKWSYKISFEKL